MKTDIERFIELYDSIGVDVVVNKRFNPSGSKCTGQWIVFGGYSDMDRETTNDDRISGYSGFYTSLNFDGDGNFVSQWIGE